VPLTESFVPQFTIVDADTLTAETGAAALRALDHVRVHGGTMLWFLGQTNAVTEHLPAPLHLTARVATALVPDATHPWTASFALPDLDFSEDGAERFIMQHGLDGPDLDGARVLLRASSTDWAQFNNAPEIAKCAAVVLDEKLIKPSGAALVEDTINNCKLLRCALDYRVASRAADAFWRRLLANAGLKLGQPADAVLPAFDEHHALVNALAVGRFGAPSLDAALAWNDAAGLATRPVAGARVGELGWQPVTSPSRDRFVFQEMKQGGAESGPYAVQFSYWIRSPRALDNLLADGPDAPRFSTICYVADQCRLFLNGRELQPTRSAPADYRTRLEFTAIPLQKGWNHFLVTVAASQLRGAKPGTLAVRIGASQEDFLRQLETAIVLKPGAEK